MWIIYTTWNPLIREGFSVPLTGRAPQSLKAYYYIYSAALFAPASGTCLRKPIPRFPAPATWRWKVAVAGDSSPFSTAFPNS